VTYTKKGAKIKKEMKKFYGKKKGEKSSLLLRIKVL